MNTPTNLNPLFIDQITSFAHLITPEPQTKEQFLNTVKSTFETIRLNNTRSTILFNQ